MNKEEGAKMVVVGGKKDVTQQYCGTVGGQSTDFSTMDTEVKVSIDNEWPLKAVCVLHKYWTLNSFSGCLSFQTTGLKNNSLAPPDLYVPLISFGAWITPQSGVESVLVRAHQGLRTRSLYYPPGGRDSTPGRLICFSSFY